ncbi:NlpC/P60 family protein [Kitasatospora sp. NPDC051914]|uniref:NlpC/P60 family protein n=1 Tax=Kitasatospora sp. NPDC051914 TaxID=3154945 RepID=UPI0034208E2E
MGCRGQGDRPEHQRVRPGHPGPYNSVKAGDLIFWGSPGNTDHVALYIGNGRIIEAAPPRGTSSVHITNVYGSRSYAIRIFG